MKLLRTGEPGKEKTAVLLGDKIVDVSSFGEDFDENFFGSDGITRLERWLTINSQQLPEISKTSRTAPPFKRPSKIICVGLNYFDHAQETGLQIPSEPVIFFKSTSAITGPNEKLIIPKQSVKTDWEVELAVVIGKKVSYVKEENALDYVAGYCLHNDYSEREFQIERGGQWVKGKSCDTFAPMGPYLATQNEITDLNNLRLWLSINGKMMQDGNSKNMSYKIPFLISYISQFMTLLPGDVISTGTPAGVGMGMKPPQYIKPGDVIELGIDHLGTQRQVAVAHS